MIYTLIQKIVLYDDKIEIYYNYADPMKADASPADEHRLFFSINGSNLLCSVSPDKLKANPFPLGDGFTFLVCLGEYES